eukprot:62223-Rhodomonas_salina.3
MQWLLLRPRSKSWGMSYDPSPMLNAGSSLKRCPRGSAELRRRRLRGLSSCDCSASVSFKNAADPPRSRDSPPTKCGVDDGDSVATSPVVLRFLRVLDSAAALRERFDFDTTGISLSSLLLCMDFGSPGRDFRALSEYA